MTEKSRKDRESKSVANGVCISIGNAMNRLFTRLLLVLLIVPSTFIPLQAQPTENAIEKIQQYEAENNTEALLLLLLDLRNQEIDHRYISHPGFHPEVAEVNEPIRTAAKLALVRLGEHSVRTIFHFFDQLGEVSFTGLFTGKSGTTLFEKYQICYTENGEDKRLPPLFNSDILAILMSINPNVLLPLFLEALRSENLYLPYFITVWSFETGLFQTSSPLEEEVYTYLYHPNINIFQCFTTLRDWINQNSVPENNFNARSLHYLQKWTSEEHIQKISHMMAFSVMFVEGKFFHTISKQMYTQVEDSFCQFGPEILNPFIEIMIQRKYFSDIWVKPEEIHHPVVRKRAMENMLQIVHLISRFPREAQRTLIIDLSQQHPIKYMEAFIILAALLNFNEDREILSNLVGYVIDPSTLANQAAPGRVILLSRNALRYMNPSGVLLWQLIDERIKKQ